MTLNSLQFKYSRNNSSGHIQYLPCLLSTIRDDACPLFTRQHLGLPHKLANCVNLPANVDLAIEHGSSSWYMRTVSQSPKQAIFQVTRDVSSS